MFPLAMLQLGFGFPVSLVALEFSKYLEISSEFGLPGTTVRCLEQDHNGIIWMGIEGIGLCKYDAHDFFLFQNTKTNPDVLTDNNVEAVFEDSKHRLWVGTMVGLNRLDRENKVFLKFEKGTNGFIGNLVDDIIEDRQGNVWFGTDQGLCVYDEKSNTFSEVYYEDTEEELHSLPRINSLYVDNQGWLWVGANGGLFKVDPKNQTCTRVELNGDWDAETAPTEIFTVTQDPEGEIWVGSDTILFILDQKTGFSKSIDINAGEQASRASAIGNLFTDSRGSIWVGTRMDGLRVIDPTTMVVKNRSFDPGTSAGVTSNHIRAIIEEKNGMIVIAVKYAGLLIYDPRREVFQHMRGTRLFNEGFNDSFIYSLRGEGEKLWIGTHRSGLFCYNSKEDSFTQYSHRRDDPTSLVSNRVENVFVESKESVWMAGASGVSKINPLTGEIENYPYNALCRDIVKISENQFWVATQGGIIIFDPETGEYKDLPIIDDIDLSGNSNINIRRLYLDSKGTLWIATLVRGLYAYDIAENRLERVLSKGPNNSVPQIQSPRNFLEDSKGRFWICTRLNGLFLVDRVKMEFRNYSVESGLPTKTIFGAVEDDAGNLWLATNSGIVQFDPEKTTSTVFDESYGLQGEIFEANCFAKTSNGYFFFGGANGLNRFKPEQVKRYKYDAQLALSNISVNGLEMITDALEPVSLELPYDQNSVSISFALLDYSFPGKNEFEYRMLGLDENWMAVGTRNFVSYPSLPPGEYKFEVRGKNPNEQSFSDETHFTLVINPPYWDTGLFRILLILVILVIIASLFIYGIYRERLQNRKLEQLITERTSEIGEAHSQLKEQTQELEVRGEEIERQNEELVQHKFYLEELVHERTKELEQARDKAQESDHLKSAFIANMSHEIRTPLNAIMGFSHLIAMEAEEEARFAEYVNGIAENTDMLVRLLNDIIDFSVIESGNLQLNNSPIDAYSLFNELSEEFKIFLSKRGTDHVEFSLDRTFDEESEIIIETDRIRLRQILQNFITNACKFTKKGTVTFGGGLNPAADHFIFYVKDTGSGIAKEHHKTVFERFFKIEDNEKSFHQGTGLGLSICSSLAESMGCRIDLESELHVGSTFKLIIPLTPEIVTASKPANLHSNSEFNKPDEEDMNWENKTILIAEDVQNNFLILEKYLSETKVKLLHAKNGKEAVAIFKEKESEIDLLLFDIKMPKMSGDEALKEIRKMAPKIAAVAQTAHALPLEKDEILKAGFNECLIKPIGHKELISTLSNFL